MQHFNQIFRLLWEQNLIKNSELIQNRRVCDVLDQIIKSSTVLQY